MTAGREYSQGHFLLIKYLLPLSTLSDSMNYEVLLQNL